MLDSETLKLIDAARDRHQFELSARLTDEAGPRLKGLPDRHAEAPREQVWNDAKAEILRAVDEYAGEGLRVLRLERTRAGMILTAPAGTWRRFLTEQKSLVKSRTIEFRHYVKPWSFGLPGFPE